MSTAPTSPLGTFRLSAAIEETHRDFIERVSAEEGVTMSAVVRAALDQYMQTSPEERLRPSRDGMEEANLRDLVLALTEL